VENLPEEPARVADPQLRLDLTESLKLLNSNERAAVLLCCQNGLSHEEAALALDCPLGTVKTNVLRGREKLKKRLGLAYENYEPT
jgi:RNA polymerase sigma-70 factor (ECF subfamily)